MAEDEVERGIVGQRRELHVELRADPESSESQNAT